MLFRSVPVFLQEAMIEHGLGFSCHLRNARSRRDEADRLALFVQTAGPWRDGPMDSGPLEGYE